MTDSIAIPEELKKGMKKFPRMDWNAIAREAIKEKIEFLEEMNKFLEKSELTEEDALRLGREVNKELAKRYKEKARG